MVGKSMKLEKNELKLYCFKHFQSNGNSRSKRRLKNKQENRKMCLTNIATTTFNQTATQEAI
jgi:hypothetical protein